ncbi:MAG: arginase family protein [Roseobacter sp.]|nr:arginase family protein [Roseobacter sp.]
MLPQLETNEAAVKLTTKPGVFLTDYKNGSLCDPATGVTVAAEELERKIVAFFQDPTVWESFPGCKADEAIAARDRLFEAGLLLHHEKTLEPGLSRAEFTMFGVPQRRLEDVERGEIVFIGAPFDVGTTAYPGCRFGPTALRLASAERFQCQLDLATGRMTAWNLPSLGGAILGGARLSDLGDLIYRAGEPVEQYYTHLSDVMSQLYGRGAFPVVLGGDHSITYSTACRKADALVHLDAALRSGRACPRSQPSSRQRP